MHLFAGILILAIIAFSVYSGLREISVYNRARKGQRLFLVSRKRLQRRLIISAMLLIVSFFLLLGFFVATPITPGETLAIWIPPLLLVLIVVYLSIQDFRETSKDLDRILRDATDAAREKIKERSETRH